MITLIAAALVAAQPAPAPSPQGQMPGMQHEQHESMKEDWPRSTKAMPDMRAIPASS